MRPAAFGETLELTSWVSALGPRWIEYRVSIRGGSGALVEGASVWVHLDPATFRPTGLDPGFVALFAPSTLGRVASARFRHAPEPVGEGDPSATVTMPWPLRVADIDQWSHVNNAVAWQIVEEVLDRRPVPYPLRAEMEYRRPIPSGSDVVVHAGADPAGVAVWVRGGDRSYLTARVEGRPG